MAQGVEWAFEMPIRPGVVVSQHPCTAVHRGDCHDTDTRARTHNAAYLLSVDIAMEGTGVERARLGWPSRWGAAAVRPVALGRKPMTPEPALSSSIILSCIRGPICGMIEVDTLHVSEAQMD